MTFKTWEVARANAQAQADKYRMDFGIESQRGLAGLEFRVFMLPKPANRQGHELTCETVRPSAPLCACGLHPQHQDGYCPAEQTARESHSEEA